jgi:serine/threonine-protein kinase
MTTERIIGGTYQITEKLGEGGMGEVFKGFDVMLEREVAIKSLRPELCSRTDIVERFRTEAIALARMNHSNIATVYNFLKENNQWFLVLEFVRGETLDKVVTRRGTLPWRDAVKFVCQALDGLEHAHKLGVVHRDIKPANMIITPTGDLKLMDFGIARLLERARLTKTGNLIGTLEYMSPEQVQGKDSDARTDIYSTGIVLYELLTGRVPFQKNSDYDLIRAQVEEQPVPPHEYLPQLPEQLENAVLTALQKNPDLRYGSAAAFQTELQSILHQQPVSSSNKKAKNVPAETRIATATPSFHNSTVQESVLSNNTSSAIHPISAWQRYRPWIVVGTVLLTTLAVALTLLLAEDDTTNTSPEINSASINSEPPIPAVDTKVKEPEISKEDEIKQHPVEMPTPVSVAPMPVTQLPSVTESSGEVRAAVEVPVISNESMPNQEIEVPLVAPPTVQSQPAKKHQRVKPRKPAIKRNKKPPTINHQPDNSPSDWGLTRTN